ncbi:hypothetical protein [Terrabacter sp. BE26]|uniref:hypothetical protein n=1 Tax=Terrabacter sp. BE26 TaxID=2898152 RepID=UPI0035BE782F
MESQALPPDLLLRPFRTEEALRRGVTPSRLRAQDLWTPTPGVRTAEVPVTLLERARAFAAAAPNEFAFAHATAARLLGIPLPYALEEDPHIHIVTRTDANRVRRGEVVGHRGLESRQVVLVEGLPVVGAADTWADLGEHVGPGRPVGLDDLIVAGDAAANLLGSADPLRRAVERRGRPRGKVTLTFAIPRIRRGAWSPMETRSRLMVTRAGLPEPEHNVPVVSHAGEWLGFGDLVWQEQRVVGEYLGVEFHTRTRDRVHDGLRRDRVERGGWTMVEIVSADVFEHEPRAAKLRELAGHLDVNPHLLDVMGAAPQFLAPAQFARPRRRRS